MPRPPSKYRTESTCETCGKTFPFVAYPSQIKLGRGRFCSKECQKQWQAIPLTTRFQKYIGPKTEAGCILWLGAVNKDGYGVIGSGGQVGNNILAHRASYIISAGPIPTGMSVLHKCDNPTCVNIDHLFLGTQADNIHDMVSKGRHRKRMPGSRRYLQDIRLGRSR